MSKMTVDELKAANARYLWHPMANPKGMQQNPPDIIARGEGSWIWDIDGHRLIDGVGGLWSANLGFGRREIGKPDKVDAHTLFAIASNTKAFTAAALQQLA